MFGQNTRTVIIIGCGRLGASIAGALSQRGFNITVLDKNEEAFRKLPENFSGYQLSGDGTDIDCLKKIGTLNAYMVLVLTENDNTNSLIAQIVSRIFNVSKVYIRLSDPDKAKVIEGFNIEVIQPLRLSMLEFERLSHLKILEG